MEFFFGIYKHARKVQNYFFLYQVEHGCTIATIGGVRGILVAGGATGDDVVEFFDWEEQTEWKVIGKMNRGRGMKF